MINCKIEATQAGDLATSDASSDQEFITFGSSVTDLCSSGQRIEQTQFRISGFRPRRMFFKTCKRIRLTRSSESINGLEVEN
ncbi:unnamed protein product [Lactuca virosa]|uniref:Uncharacterized protein n=1 Tax=Lactuca virosa TaxID=75947 RepID=A0AAU9LH51_9ASTR|nr:unnamed protein product [Lactuca virosa]